MKTLFFMFGLLYFSFYGSKAAEKNIEALRKYVPGVPGNLKFTVVTLGFGINVAPGINIACGTFGKTNKRSSLN